MTHQLAPLGKVWGKVVSGMVVMMMLGAAVLGLASPAGALADAAHEAISEVVDAVAGLPELSALTPEELEQLQTDLRAALQAAVENDIAAGVEPVVPVEDIVGAVQEAAASSEEISLEALVAAAVNAYGV